MLSRWNSQILPRTETAISYAFAFSESARFGSSIKILSSDNIPAKDTIQILVVKLLITNSENYGTNKVLLTKGFNCGVPISAQIRIPRVAS